MTEIQFTTVISGSLHADIGSETSETNHWLKCNNNIIIRLLISKSKQQKNNNTSAVFRLYAWK